MIFHYPNFVLSNYKENPISIQNTEDTFNELSLKGGGTNVYCSYNAARRLYQLLILDK